MTGGRHSRKGSTRGKEYERELTGLREALKGADGSLPMTASELYELERLIRKYPAQARRFLAAVDEGR